MRRELADDDIREAIQKLETAGGSLTARALRAALKEQFGHCGNSVRVHRILRADRMEMARQTSSAIVFQEDLAKARADAEQWKARAELAQHRERTHQDKWANEIHHLREALKAARQAASSATDQSTQYLKLYEDRARLRARVESLEAQLKATR